MGREPAVSRQTDLSERQFLDVPIAMANYWQNMKAEDCRVTAGSFYSSAFILLPVIEHLDRLASASFEHCCADCLFVRILLQFLAFVMQFAASSQADANLDETSLKERIKRNQRQPLLASLLGKF